MDAMTMGFEIEDTALLAGVTPGDRVRFTVTRDGARLRLVALDRRVRS
jgi:Cu/Ag efflux protein CusF